MNKILIIHPHDNTTDFLKPIYNNLRNHRDYEEKIILHRPTASSENQEMILSIIRKNIYNLVLFMGHGKSNALYGAVNEYRNIDEKGFINEQNIDVFKDKSVISLSCKSNEKIAILSIKAGAKVFVGFGNLPTDWNSEIGQDEGLTKKDVNEFNSIFKLIVFEALYYSLEHQFTFFQFEKVFKIITNKKIIELTDKKYSTNNWIIQSLYNLKDEIKVFGDSSLKLYT